MARYGFHTIHFSPMFGGTAPALDVVRATAAAGFDAIGLDLASLDAHIASGGNEAGLIGSIVDAGLACSDVLVLVAGVDPDIEATARRIGALAAAVGAPCCVAAVGADRPWPALVADLRACAGVLADHGCRLAIEFTPYTPLATLGAAIELCGEVGWDRAGLVVDSLHFFRSGAPWRELEGLRAEQIDLVQWSDAPAATPASLVDESRNRRLLPGEGGLPLHDLAVAICTIAPEVTFSAEVLSAAVRARDPAVAVPELYAALTASVAAG